LTSFIRYAIMGDYAQKADKVLKIKILTRYAKYAIL